MGVIKLINRYLIGIIIILFNEKIVIVSIYMGIDCCVVINLNKLIIKNSVFSIS